MNRQGATISEPSGDEDAIAKAVVDAAFAVHSALGPGLPESIYEQCLAHELEKRRVAVRRQVVAPSSTAAPPRRRTASRRARRPLDRREVKAFERVVPVHEAQVLSHLKPSGYRIGLLVKFNVPLIKHGIRRLIRTA